MAGKNAPTKTGESSASRDGNVQLVDLRTLKEELIEVFRTTGSEALTVSRIRQKYQERFGRKLNAKLVKKYGHKDLSSALRIMSDVFCVDEKASSTSKMLVNFIDPTKVHHTEDGTSASAASIYTAGEHSDHSASQNRTEMNAHPERHKGPLLPPPVLPNSAAAGFQFGSPLTVGDQASSQSRAEANSNLDRHKCPLLPLPQPLSSLPFELLPGRAMTSFQFGSLPAAAATPSSSGATASTAPNQLVSLRDIMQEQKQHQEKQTVSYLPTGGESGSGGKKKSTGKVQKKLQYAGLDSVAEGATGLPGPFEEAFNKAQQTPGRSVRRKRPTPQEVNQFVQDTIDELSENGDYVSKDVIIAQLLRVFGVSNTKELGFYKETEIPAIRDLIRLQNKAEMFVHAYVLVHSVSTLHEVSQSLANLEEKTDFLDLKLGPLAKQPAIYKLFKFPQDREVPKITTIQILKHLRQYMEDEDLWQKKVQLDKFIEYLCPLYDCQDPFDLGVRIGGIGLPISVIKKASRVQSEKMNLARVQVEDDMEKEIRKRLQKIKTDLLGQHTGDLRSMVENLLGASPSDIIMKTFDHCLELFSGKEQTKVKIFLNMIVGSRLARQLFQLALHMGCQNLVKPIMSDIESTAERDERKLEAERQHAVEPPREGEVVNEVKKWLQKMDVLDLGRLSRVESQLVGSYSGFTSFDSFGYGPFLQFVTRHKELHEILQQLGRGTLPGHGGIRTGPVLLLSHVLDFIAQCGVRTEKGKIQECLCAHYKVTEVKALGMGAFDRLLSKAKDRQQERDGRSVIYESALLCKGGTPHSNSFKPGDHRSCGVLGSRDKEHALDAIASTPLLGDISSWTQWESVFSPEHGSLKEFLVKEGMLASGRKTIPPSAIPGHRTDVVALETQPGLLLRVTLNTSPEHLKNYAEAEDAVGCAGHLVSLVIANGTVEETPVALLANHMRSALQALNSRSSEGSCRCTEFVLRCLTRIPSSLCISLAPKIFLKPLEEIVGSADMPALVLSSCQSDSQRSRMHQLGFALGITQWEKDFKTRTSAPLSNKEVNEGGEKSTTKKPFAVVQPIQSSPRPPENVESTINLTHIDKQTDERESDLEDVPDDQANELPNADVMDEEQEKCRELIEKIRRDEFGIEVELGEKEKKLVQRQSEREGRALSRLSTELYSRDTHFVLELVQNADDNSYPPDCSPALAFILEADNIVVLNNECGFTESNIRALCDVGKSTKGEHRYGYIGQKGIGFKSVFRITDRPEVHSNGYHICFDAKNGPVGLILPQWINQTRLNERVNKIHPADEEKKETTQNEDSHQSSSDEDLSEWTTQIVLPLKVEFQRAQNTSLAARFREIHPSLLLFLHRLRRITVINRVDNKAEHMVRTDLGNSVMEVTHSKGTDRWLVVKKELDASKIKEDVKVTELALAFPLPDHDHGRMMANPKDFANHQNVFAYLPLRSYGFRFIIQGDFEVPSSREDVDSDKVWNQWLREEIPQLFLESLDVFRNHQLFPGLSSISTYLQFVPLEEEIQNFFAPVARHIFKLLQGTPCIPVEPVKREAKAKSSTREDNGAEDSGSNTDVHWVLSCKAVRCSTDLSMAKKLVPPALLERHLGLYYLHSGVDAAINPALRIKLGIENLSSSHLIEIGKEESKRFATGSSNQDAEGSDFLESGYSNIDWVANWLCCLHRCLSREHESSQEILDQIASLPIIPLTDGSFVSLKADPVFFPLLPDHSVEGKKSTSSSCAAILQKDLRTLHPQFFSALDSIGRSEVNQLLHQLGVKSWSAREVIESHILPTLMSEKWKGKPDDIIRSYLVYIQEQRCTNASVCDLGELRKCARVLTNKGIVNPSEIPVHFTPRYGNPIDLKKQLPSVSWTLLDESYLRSCVSSKAVTMWEEFFAELGVNNFLAIERKQTTLHRRESLQSPWASSAEEWPSTSDGAYIIYDWSCSELNELMQKSVNPKEAEVLAKCLDERWDKEYSKYAQLNVPVKDTDGNELLQTFSSFYLNLVSKPWVPATSDTGNAEKGALPCVPRELYLRTKEVYSLLDKHVSYTEWNLQSSMFKEALKFKTSINFDTMMEELTRWATPSDGDHSGVQKQVFTMSLSHMKRVYSFLHVRCSQSQDEKTRLREAFVKQPLLFVPQTQAGPSCSGEKDVKGIFCFKKEVCWEDPSGVARALNQQRENAVKRHMLAQFYGEEACSRFLFDVLKIDKTPNMDEYVEMASMLAEINKVPTPSAVREIRKLFAELGEKCIAKLPRQSMPPDMPGMIHSVEEPKINPVKSGYLKERLKDEEVFPTADSWVSLSAKPMLPDEKHLLKIFEKEKDVFFLDLGDLSDVRSSPMRSRRTNYEDVQHQRVLTFLKACGIASLSDSIKKEFVPTLLETPCIPLQKHFHTVVPCMQRFLYSQLPETYDELKLKEVPKKLQNMMFATVQRLETVYSIKDPVVIVPVEKNFGLDVVGSSFWLYAVKEHVNNMDELKAEIVNLFTFGRRSLAPRVRNFLIALQGVIQAGSDVEKFLRDDQELLEIPDSEELWSVPAPPAEEPKVATPELEELPQLVAKQPQQEKLEDGEMYCWPPKSSAFPRKGDAPVSATVEETLKQWPLPAPPESMSPHDGAVLSRAWPLKGEQGTYEPNRMGEEVYTVAPMTTTDPPPPGRYPMTSDGQMPHHGQVPQAVPQPKPQQGAVGPLLLDRGLVQTANVPVIGNARTLGVGEASAEANTPHTQQSPSVPHATLNSPAAQDIGPSFSIFVCSEEDIRQEFEELPLGGHLEMPEALSLGSNSKKEEIGRWGEMFVMKFLEGQKNMSPPGLEIQIRWMNEEHNSNAPYDFEIIRRYGSEMRTITTYVEVKATSSDKKDFFEISSGELKFAFEKREALHLYRVFNAGKAGHVRLSRLQNLAENLDRKTVKLCMVI